MEATLLTGKSTSMALPRNKQMELVDSTIIICGIDIAVILWHNVMCVYAFL